MTRPELIVAVRRVMESDGTEQELDELVERVARAVPHPGWTELVFHDDRGLTAEQVVEEALAYESIRL